MSAVAKSGIENFTDAEIKEEFELRGLSSDDVDPDIDEFSDNDIRDEYFNRELDRAESDSREACLLAEMIAAGEAARALDLLAEMHPGQFQPHTVARMVSERKAACGRLF